MPTFAQHGNSSRDWDLARVEKEFRLSSEQLLNQFRTACERASLLLSHDELGIWANEALALSRYSPPLSLEATKEYFRVTPEVLGILPFPRFLDWVSRGKMLCRDSPGLAAAYFRASPKALAMLPGRQIEVWLAMGPGLYNRSAESMELACRYFDATPALLQSLSLIKMERFALFLERLAETSYDLAAECLGSAHRVLATLEEEERGPFLAVALALVRLNPRASATFFQRGTEALAGIAGGQRRRFLSLMGRIARYNGQLALSFLTDCSQAFGRIDSSLHSRFLDRSEAVLAISTIAGVEFLKNCPAVLAEIGIPGLERWFREGVRLLGKDEKAGLAHFRLEFPEERALERLLVKVELDQVKEVLLMYGQALGGTEIEIRPSESLAEWSMGAIDPGTPTTDGTTIFLPSSMDRYDSNEENFTWYKVAVTHQAGHIEFGTFDFCFEKEAVLFPDRRHQLPSTDGAGLTDIERFLSLFDDRRLAADIFSLVEDIMVDYLVKYGYAGIRAGYKSVQQETVWRRPSLDILPLREAFLEILIRISLDGELPIIPAILRSPVESALKLLQRLQSPRATVEDAAEAALRLCEIAGTIANTRGPEREWEITNPGEGEPDMAVKAYRRSDSDNVTLESGVEVPYQAPTDVEYRGNSHPDMLHILPKPEDDSAQGAPSPVSPPGSEVQLNGIMQGRNVLSGQYTTDLPGEIRAGETVSTGQDGNTGLSDIDYAGKGTILREDGQSYLYDEWDFHAGCYRPKWCRVREKLLPEGSTDFFEETLVRSHLLAAQVRKQFEMITPEFLRKADRLYDGEELDLDAVVRAVVERKAGCASDEKIYWKRRKVQRDVAAILLLDMSASTGNIIKDTDGEYPEWYLDLMEGSPRMRAQGGEVLTGASRRVIDVMKESVVLMMNALEGVGDSYGVYGFSGHGRENVEILVIKGIDEGFSGTVKSRVGSIAPLHGTRMGSAIRHATSKLDTHDAKTKLLFLVSDGYPQDEDYGQGDGDEEYALQDTRMAFLEARRKNIMPFCLTVDIAGYDYLRRICHDINYEVVNDIESLPQRLPLLYKRLTS